MKPSNDLLAFATLRVSQIDHSVTSVLSAFRAGARFCLAGGTQPCRSDHQARGVPERELDAMLTGYDVTRQLMGMLDDHVAVEAALTAAMTAVRQSRTP